MHKFHGRRVLPILHFPAYWKSSQERVLENQPVTQNIRSKKAKRRIQDWFWVISALKNVRPTEKPEKPSIKNTKFPIKNSLSLQNGCI